MYFVFQADTAWKDVHFNSFGAVIENVFRVDIDFQSFSGQDVYVKDLYIHACQTPRMCCIIYYAALLPRRGPHIASHSVCLSVCPSVPLSLPLVTSFRQPLASRRAT